MNEPRQGVATEAKVVRVIDADTLEVEVKRTIKVRLLGCNVPDKDKEISAKAFKHVTQILDAYDNKVLLFVPPGRSSLRLGDIHSFERILGEIWINGNNLSETLIACGFAEKA